MELFSRSNIQCCSVSPSAVTPPGSCRAACYFNCLHITFDSANDDAPVERVTGISVPDDVTGTDMCLMINATGNLGITASLSHFEAILEGLLAEQDGRRSCGRVGVWACWCVGWRMRVCTCG